MIVEASDVIDTDRMRHAICRHKTKRSRHGCRRISDVIPRARHAKTVLMQGEKLLHRRIAPPLYPALQHTDSMITQWQRLISHMLEGQRPITVENIFAVKIMLMSMDVDICRMGILRCVREQYVDPLQRHHHLIDDECKSCV